MVWRNPSQATANRGPEANASRPADLERSNTGTSISTFFFGKAPRHTLARRHEADSIVPAPLLPYLSPRSKAPRTLPLRASKLIQVDKLPRDERIAAWQAGRDDELGGLERWRAQVAREVRREDDEVRAAGGDVSDAVHEFQSMLQTSRARFSLLTSSPTGSKLTKKPRSQPSRPRSPSARSSSRRRRSSPTRPSSTSTRCIATR